MKMVPTSPDVPGDAKTVVVAVRMDQQSRELLTWALVKVAVPGDTVLALHVAPAAAAADDLLALLKELESVIAVYEGFCNLKQIDLKLKVSRGSIRKTIVQQVKSLLASTLILGVLAKTAPHIRSSTSFAKNCAKKLPPSCSVLAVHNGKIAYRRDAVATAGPLVPETHRIGTVDPASADAHQILTSLEAARSQGTELRECEVGSSTCSMSNLIPETGPGWPLLRRTMRSGSVKERSKMSVVQWAMRLPSRYSASPVVHPEAKRTKPVMDFVPNDEDKKIAEELALIRDKYSSVCRVFGYRELALATSNFSPENMVGKGGSSGVYKGCLPDGKEVAVKILKPTEDALQEFVSEVEIITTLHHKNIVSLFGFCFENDNLILVYDFLSRGSLEEILHGENENKSILSWVERYKVAEGVAEALDYLHGGGDDSEPVIHRDVKSSNILLSDNLEPKLCDFGLAQWASTSSTHITCNDVAGTFGYLAPEYFMYGKVNEKIDVYAFGVVLLELISGRKPLNTGSPKGQESLVMWAKPILHGGKVKELVDPSLGDEYDSNQMERMVLAASLCIRRSAHSRPRIVQILKLLHGDEDVVEWARSEIGGSEEFGGSDDESETPNSIIQSHINLALLDIDDETNSVSSVEPAAQTSLEKYLQGRWSRSSSFD